MIGLGNLFFCMVSAATAQDFVPCTSSAAAYKEVFADKTWIWRVKPNLPSPYMVWYKTADTDAELDKNPWEIAYPSPHHEINRWAKVLQVRYEKPRVNFLDDTACINQPPKPEITTRTASEVKPLPTTVNVVAPEDRKTFPVTVKNKDFSQQDANGRPQGWDFFKSTKGTDYYSAGATGPTATTPSGCFKSLRDDSASNWGEYVRFSQAFKVSEVPNVTATTPIRGLSGSIWLYGNQINRPGGINGNNGLAVYLRDVKLKDGSKAPDIVLSGGGFTGTCAWNEYKFRYFNYASDIAEFTLAVEMRGANGLACFGTVSIALDGSLGSPPNPARLYGSLRNRFPIMHNKTEKSELREFAENGFTTILGNVDAARPVDTAYLDQLSALGLSMMPNVSIQSFGGQTTSIAAIDNYASNPTVTGFWVGEEPKERMNPDNDTTNHNTFRAMMIEFIALDGGEKSKASAKPTMIVTNETALESNLRDVSDVVTGDFYGHPLSNNEGYRALVAASNGADPVMPMIGSFQRSGLKNPGTTQTVDGSPTWMLPEAYGAIAAGAKGVTFFGCHDQVMRDTASRKLHPLCRDPKNPSNNSLGYLPAINEVARRLRYLSDVIVYGDPLAIPRGFPSPAEASNPVRWAGFQYDRNRDGVSEFYVVVANLGDTSLSITLPYKGGTSDKKVELFALDAKAQPNTTTPAQGGSTITIGVDGLGAKAFRFLQVGDIDYAD